RCVAHVSLRRLSPPLGPSARLGHTSKKYDIYTATLLENSAHGADGASACAVVRACNLAVLSRLPTGNPTKECAMIGGPRALGDKLQRIIDVDCSNVRLTQEAKQKIIPRSQRSGRRMPGYLRTRGE